MIDHRRHPRFHLLHTSAVADDVEGQVRNLSRSGMLLASPTRLSVGRQHDFEISDRNHRLGVAGAVRWSRSGEGEAFLAGIEFDRVVANEARTVWARLVAESGETGLPVGHRPAAQSTGRVPLLTILSPEDGAIVRHGAVTVIGQVRDPGLGSLIEVNGVRALVYGRRFEARVRLVEGPNLLSAAVSTSGSPVCRSPAVRITQVRPGTP